MSRAINVNVITMTFSADFALSDVLGCVYGSGVEVSLRVDRHLFLQRGAERGVDVVRW